MFTGARMHAIRENWRGKVYKVSKKMSTSEQYKWRMIRDEVLRRDNFTCQRCDTKFRQKKKLSAHHIIPRIEGGSDDMTNLITLCNPCHDYVEIYGLKTRADIIGSYDDDMHGVSIVDKDDDTPDPYNRPSWHKIVYGGQKRKN